MTPEGATLNAILDYLRLRHVFAWRNNSGTLRDRTGRPVTFGLKGSSDILGCTDDGRILAIEVKALKGRVTEEQKDFLESIARRGGVAFVARSVEDVIRVLYAREVQ